MPVPSSISDLSTTPALNSPPGSESPSSIDDYLRTHAAFIKQVSDASVQTSGNQTVAGTKTFSASPVAPNPTAGTRSQALATMQMFADEFAALKSPSGYQKLPSGLIIQWGFVGNINNGAASPVTFPVAFPNGYLCALCNPLSPGANTNSYSGSIASFPAPSITGMSMSNNSASSGAIAANWVALGW